MIRPLRFLDEYFRGSETRVWYMSQVSKAREFVLDPERLKKYVSETSKEMYFFLGFGRALPDIALGYGTARLVSGDSDVLSYIAIGFGEILRLTATTLQKFERMHVREYNLDRTIEEETADQEPLITNEDDFESV